MCRGWQEQEGEKEQEQGPPRGREISQLEATFYMERPLGHYLFDIYLPAACIVFMSWINFCLSR